MGRTPESLGRIGFSRRHTHRGTAFAVVLGVTWIVGLFGLQENGTSAVRLPLVVLIGLAGYGVVLGIRRTMASRRARIAEARTEPPPTCVTVQWFGEERSRRAHPSGHALDAAMHVRVVDNVIPLERPAARSARRLDYIPLPKP